MYKLTVLEPRAQSRWNVIKNQQLLASLSPLSNLQLHFGNIYPRLAAIMSSVVSSSGHDDSVCFVLVAEHFSWRHWSLKWKKCILPQKGRTPIELT